MLRKAEVNGANLGGAQLAQANLSRSSFIGADLRGADMRDVDATTEQLQSEEDVELRLHFPSAKPADGVKSVLLVVLNEKEAGTTPEWVGKVAAEGANVSTWSSRDGYQRGS